jgi:hypothetical protein
VYPAPKHWWMVPKNQLKKFFFGERLREQMIAKTWVKTKIFAKAFSKTKTLLEILLRKQKLLAKTIRDQTFVKRNISRKQKRNFAKSKQIFAYFRLKKGVFVSTLS